MSLEIRVPSLGESIVDATIVQWLKNPGEQVDRNEPLVELETDKVNVEVPAEQAGVLESISREAGETVEVGELLGMILEGAVSEEAPEEEAEQVAESPAPAPPEEAEPAAAGSRRAGPEARRLAEERSINLDDIAGTGPGGRVMPQDVLQYQPAAVATPEPAPATAAAPPPTPTAPASEISPNGHGDDREERVRLSRRRQTIARRLVEAQQSAAMLTTFNEVDMSAVMDLRSRRRDEFEERHGVRLGYMSFFTKAVVGALKAHPEVNAELDGDELILKSYYDIGIAVGAEEGLVVPVVRDADRKSFAEIEREIRELAGKVRDKTLDISDLMGGTFTITNGGIYGSLLSTPILNTPQVGILGMHKIQERPVVVDGAVVVRPMMYTALSYDHRVVDGQGAVQFLVRIKELIEDPETMLLEG
ncbi:MAG: 2-oxoglutarate dehydrogenase complex dihydrolipoyllysine-residue succinyltransferase [Thermomicrobiales bacterium]